MSHKDLKSNNFTYEMHYIASRILSSIKNHVGNFKLFRETIKFWYQDHHRIKKYRE